MVEAAPSETEKETAYGVRTMDVGTLTILGTFDPTQPDRQAPYERAVRDERP